MNSANPELSEDVSKNPSFHFNFKSLSLEGEQMDHLGVGVLDLNASKQAFIKTVSGVGCSPPYSIDPRIHLNGPFVSLRKVQKHQELARQEILKERRNKLRKLIECDRKEYMCGLLKQGLTLYTDVLL